ncbi:MAG: FtsW/RodA/SpoVE family cell cycle protein [Chloroflexi bacterium]|nr:FtsW/RodA/SpoVE family cell cycle protein [Chloroflexota bacterium]
MSSWNSEPAINNQRERILLGLAILFVFSNGIALGLVQTAAFNLRHLWPVSLWAVLAIGGQLLLHRYKPTHDPYLWPLVSLLLGWGILLVDRLAPNFLARQVAWVALGTAVALAVAIWPRNLRFLRQYRYTWLLGGLLLLGATFLFGVNPSGFGAQQWLRLPFLRFIYFQPSELLKLLLVVYLASYFADRQELLRLNGRHTLPYLAPLLLMWGFCMILLVWQRDLGAATLFFILFLTLLYLATGERLYVWGGLGLLALAAVFAYFAFDVVTLRVDAWWNPWPEADNRAFQIVQSLYALASGGVFGRGIGQGFPHLYSRGSLRFCLCRPWRGVGRGGQFSGRGLLRSAGSARLVGGFAQPTAVSHLLGRWHHHSVQHPSLAHHGRCHQTPAPHGCYLALCQLWREFAHG